MWICDKIAQIGQNLALSMQKMTPAWKKYTTAGNGGSLVIEVASIINVSEESGARCLFVFY